MRSGLSFGGLDGVRLEVRTLRKDPIHVIHPIHLIHPIHVIETKINHCNGLKENLNRPPEDNSFGCIRCGKICQSQKG